MAQPHLENLKVLVQQHLPGVANLECRHFFSGAALFVQGILCVSLTPAGLAFKLPDDLCTELMNTGAGAPLKYFEKSPVKKGYAVFADFEQLGNRELQEYFKAAVAYSSLRS